MLAKRINSFWIASFLLYFSLHSQTSSQAFNPFSRYGVGEVEDKGFAPLAGMGRATTAFENDTLAPVFINIANPSSLASVQLTCFEAGGKSNFNFLSSQSAKSFKNISYLSYISLAVPLGRKSGMAFGISPFSAIGYKIVDEYNDPNIGDMQTQYEGNGGINQVFLGYGIKPFKNMYTRFRKSRRYDSLSRAGKWNVIKRKRIIKTTLSTFSLGANGYFMFGDLDNTTRVIYPSNSLYFHTKRIRNTRISDFYSSYGALMTLRFDSSLVKRKCIIYDTSKAGSHPEFKNDCPCKDSLSKEEYNRRFPKKFQRGMKKDLRITLGATAYLPGQLSAEYTALAYTYKPFSTDYDIPFDTTLNIQRSGSITMPLIMSFGIGIKKGNSLTILADVSMQNWSYYRFFGEDPKLKNSMRYSLGFQYISNERMGKVDREFFKKRTFFRGGLYYNTGSLDLKNTLISEYGITAGIGMPLGKHVMNHLNLSADFGTWGTTQNNLIKNNYIRLTLGLTLNDRWFVKRVID
jgi:hypothetical protein